MKGVIFQLARTAIEEKFGSAVWEDLLDAVGSDGVFAARADYPDEILEAMLEASGDALGKDRDSRLATLGEWVMPHLAAAYQPMVDAHDNLRDFLNSIEGVIHVEVRRLYRDSAPPAFENQDHEDGTLEMLYRSPRQMSALAEGFIRGAAPLFDESVEVQRIPEGDAMRILVTGLA